MTMDNGTGLARVEHAGGNMTATQSADGSRSLARTSAHTVSLAARQEAEVKARYAMAVANPRDLDSTRLRLTRRCESPRFAAVARYKKPQGKKKNDETGQWEQQFIEGWSIRFVEEAIRTMGNIAPEDRVTSEDSEKLTVYVSVTDLESNISYGSEIIVPRTVERKDLKRGQQPLNVRVNSYGDNVYLVAASDDEVRMSKARLVSMTLRTLGLRLIPGDILDECLEIVMETQQKDVKSDPTEARKKLIAAFDQIGIKPEDLRAYLGGRPLDALTPDMILELRAVYTMVKEEGTHWRSVLAASPHIEDVSEDDGGAKNPAADKLRGQIEAKSKEMADKERARNAVLAVAKGANVDPRQVQAIIALSKQGKTIVDIARYGREQTGIEDEVVVGEVVSRARAAGLLPPEQKAEESKPPSSPPPAETAQQKPAPARGRGGKGDAKRQRVAEQEGVSVELVAAIEEMVNDGQVGSETAMAAVLASKGHPTDQPTVAAVLAALKKA